MYNLETLKFMRKFKNEMLPTPFRDYILHLHQTFITTKREIQKKKLLFIQSH